MITNFLPSHVKEAYEIFRFELRTWFARSRRRHLCEFPDHDYLHLGCDQVILDKFLNTDCFGNPNADFNLDIRFPLPFRDECWSGLYAHHSLEHVHYYESCAFFKEAFRILRPGGILRIAVPDGRKFIEGYAKSNPANPAPLASLFPEWMNKGQWATAMDVVAEAFYGGRPYNLHHFCWDETTLCLRLREAGFNEAVSVPCGESTDPTLSRLDNPNWAGHSLYVEATR